ncbi:MAG: Fe-S cluster assembly ATPase SufC [Candidatus Gracilibacteria bacterium]|nr:Fe-S cluster assembly ATPase SufC [Candidatus Gracilibacteria bacterium]
MIQIKDLKVGVADKEILKGVSIDFEIGKNYCLLGKNGSGKSTLSAFLMGHPKYEYISGEIQIDGNNLLELSPEDRSKAGLFLSFQNVPEIKGIRLSEYLRTIYNIHLKNTSTEVKELSPFIFKRFIKKYLEELHIDDRFLDRELNVGFSGGEKRKIEILQMKLIGPKYIILDEIDSGLDLDAFRTIAEMLKQLSSENNTLIIITHYFKILDYIDVDKVYVMKDGNIIREGGNELVEEIKDKGFKDL